VHELGISQGIIERAREAAEQAGAARVGVLYVTITPAADFTRESIEMYFEMLAGEEPMFTGARLEWDEAPVDARCLGCGADFPVAVPEPECPRCGSAQVRIDAQAAMIQLTGLGVDDDVGNEERDGGENDGGGGESGGQSAGPEDTTRAGCS